MNKNILLCGVGGQGTVLASKLIASAAMSENVNVSGSETIGMAQKGGSVTSHLRLGDNVFSPMLSTGSADVILAFEPGEAAKNLSYLKPEGTLIVSTRPVIPSSLALNEDGYNKEEIIEYLKENVKNLILLDTELLCKEIGSYKVLNILLLAKAAKSGLLGLSEKSVENAIREKVNAKFLELNLKAFKLVK